jgi:PKD repeat protein
MHRFFHWPLFLTAVLICLTSAHAADVVSTFKVGAGMWSVDANWTNTPALGGFPNDGNAGVATYDAIVGSGTATLDENITIEAFTQSGGTVTGGYTLTAHGLHTWKSGTLSGTGINVDLGGLAITGTVSLSGRMMEPMAASTLAGGYLTMSSGAVVTNPVGVTFSVLDDSSIFNGGGVAPAMFNLGTVVKTGGGENVSGAGKLVTRIDTPLFNYGTARASVGTLQLAGGGTTTGTLDTAAGAQILLTGSGTLAGAIISGGGTGQVSTATTTLSNSVSATVATFLHSGGIITGPGLLTTTGLFSWTGGTQSGSGTNIADGPLAIHGSVSLSGRTIEPMASATLAGGYVSMGSGAVITNPVGVTFSVLDDSSFFNGGGVAPALFNLGTVVKTGGGENVSGAGKLVTRIDTLFFNYGTARASVGTLQLAGGGTTTGTLDTAAGAQILLTGSGTLDGALISGGGTGQVSTATTTLSNSVSATVATFLHSGGIITGPGLLTTSGLFSWTGGTESGSGTNITDGLLAIDGSVSLSGRTVEALGSATLAGGYVSMGGGAVLDNKLGSTFDIVDDSSLFNGGGVAPWALNEGVFKKSGSGNNASGAGPGMSRADVIFTNIGTVYIESGTLDFTAAYVQTAGSTVLTGGVFEASSPINIQGGSLIGKGMILANVTNNGTISPGFSANALHVFGNLTCLSNASAIIEVGGTTQGTEYDWLHITNSVVLGGTLHLRLINGFQPVPAGGAGATSFTVLTADGSLSGSFGNVASGGRLNTDDGSGSFVVTYSALTKTVVLDAFMPSPAPVADFTAGPTSGVAPLTVTFTNLTSGAVTTYSWDFGDGTISAQVNPSHTYTSAGVFTVSLTATGPGGNNTRTKNSFITATAAPPPVCVTPPAGMVGWWPGDGNANDLVGGNNGTLEGGVSFVAGKVSQAFSFDGSAGSVVVPDAPALDVSTEFTLDAWINPAALQTDPAQGGIISKVGGPNGNNGYQLGITSGNGQVICLFNAPGEAWTANKLAATLASPIPTNTWTHIAATYDHTNLTIYVNGQSVGSLLVGAKTVASSSSNLRISGDDNGNVHFNGLIDEAEVFNRALTQAEIQAIVNADTAGKCKPTLCTLTCPANVVVSNAVDQCGAVVNFALPAVSGPCGPVSCTPTNGSFFAVGVTTVNCVATDAAGNTNKCSFTVTVKDTQPPSITCPANIVSATDPDRCTAKVPFAPTATDNCPGVTSACVPPSGSTFAVGMTIVNCVATDAAGNTNKCSFTVTVNDTQPPSITCPANIVSATDPDQCTAKVPFAATATDNCPGVTSVCTPPSGSTFAVGMTIVNCVATDAAGNTNKCSFTVTVNDTQPPSITCPANIVSATDPDQCTAKVPFAPTATDNCPGVTSVCTPPSGSTFAVGMTIVNCVATDAAGNTNKCSFTVTVKDTQPPSITCPTNIVTVALAGQANVIVNYPDPVAADNCPGVTASCAPPSGSAFAVGITKVTCTSTDTSGNTNACTFTVTVNSTGTNTFPTITCPSNLVTNNTPGQCARTLAFAPAATGNPAPAVTCKIGGTVISSPYSFPVGTNTVTCSASNLLGVADCLFTIVVIDTEPPVITCPAPLAVQCDKDVPAPNPAAVTATDNCVPAPVVKYGGDDISGSCPKIIKRTYTATDATGNVAACIQTITVHDTIAPVISGCTNLSVAAPTGQLGTTVNYALTAVDNCDGSVSVTCTPQAGYFAVGDTPVNCQAIDHCSNVATCTFIVTVKATTDSSSACAFTQGFWGNANGQFNGATSLKLLGELLEPAPLVVGKLGTRSLSIMPGDALLLEQRLPAGGPPAALPNGGDQVLGTATEPLLKKGRFNNVFLGQVITLALNGRLSPALLSFGLIPSLCTQGVLAGLDGLLGTADDQPIGADVQNFAVPASVLSALADPNLNINDHSVQGLLALANRGLAGLPTGAAGLGDLNQAVDAINSGFDGCRALANCATSIVTQVNDSFAGRPKLGVGAGAVSIALDDVKPSTPPPTPPLNLVVRSSNLTATKEPGEPEIAGNPGGKSVWWQWQAPRTGLVTIETTGSSFDTLLGVFSGTALSNLVLVASNDDASAGVLSSEVTFQAQAGANYQITVDGFDGAAGEIVLTIIAAPPELCLPTTLTVTPVSLCINGEIGLLYTVEASPDLVNWTLLATAINSDGTLRFTDPARSNFPRRFYRVTAQPH